MCIDELRSKVFLGSPLIFSGPVGLDKLLRDCIETSEICIWNNQAPTLGNLDYTNEWNDIYKTNQQGIIYLLHQSTRWDHSQKRHKQIMYITRSYEAKSTRLVPSPIQWNHPEQQAEAEAVCLSCLCFMMFLFITVNPSSKRQGSSMIRNMSSSKHFLTLSRVLALHSRNKNPVSSASVIPSFVLTTLSESYME